MSLDYSVLPGFRPISASFLFRTSGISQSSWLDYYNSHLVVHSLPCCTLKCIILLFTSFKELDRLFRRFIQSWAPLILPFGSTILAILCSVHLWQRTSSPFAEDQEADCISNGSEDPGDESGDPREPELPLLIVVGWGIGNCLCLCVCLLVCHDLCVSSSF